jgi:hypothetical protein
MKFLTSIVLSRTPEQKRVFELSTNLIFESSKYQIIVYSGHITDGASVPRFMWWLMDPFSGNYLPAAIIHDALYASQILSKEESDLIFLEGMLCCGVSNFTAHIMYNAVKLFG